MKKILFINAFVIGEKSGTGNTFANLFAHYPKDKILQLCVEERNIKNSETDYNTVYSTKLFYPIDSLFRIILAKKNGGISALPEFQGHTEVNLKTAVHDFGRGILDMSPIFLPRNFLKIIDAFEPDVIYTCGATIRILKMTNYFADRYQKRIIIHLMDDWPETIYTTSKLSRISHWIILKQLEKANNKSTQNFAISTALADKYRQKYHRHYVALMNPAINIVEQPARNLSSIIRFTYAGSLSLNRWQSLLEIARILDELNMKGLTNEFLLYIPGELNTKKNREMFEDEGAHVYEYVAPEHVGSVYSASDILVYTESFEYRVSKFTKYSLSTKVPEYMGAGKPILAYLPNALHSGDYIRQEQVGLVANNRTELEECLTILLTNEELRHNLASNGIKCARTNHSIDASRRKLEEAINLN